MLQSCFFVKVQQILLDNFKFFQSGLIMKKQKIMVVHIRCFFIMVNTVKFIFFDAKAVYVNICEVHIKVLFSFSTCFSKYTEERAERIHFDLNTTEKARKWANV